MFMKQVEVEFSLLVHQRKHLSPGKGGKGLAQDHLVLSNCHPGSFPLYYSVLAWVQGFAQNKGCI